MDSQEFITALKKAKRKPIQTKGLPNLQNGQQYNFDIFQDSDHTFCIKIHDWHYDGRDQLAMEPKFPEQLNYIASFAVSRKESDVYMFNSLNAFENFLEAIIPLAINNL